MRNILSLLPSLLLLQRSFGQGDPPAFSVTREQAWLAADSSLDTARHCHATHLSVLNGVPHANASLRVCYHTSNSAGPIDGYDCYANPAVQEKEVSSLQLQPNVTETRKLFGTPGTFHTADAFNWGPKVDGQWFQMQGFQLLPVHGYPYINISGSIKVNLITRPEAENSFIEWFLVYSYYGSNIDYQRLAHGHLNTVDAVQGGMLKSAWQLKQGVVNIKNTAIQGFKDGYIALWMRNVVYDETGTAPGVLSLQDALKFHFFSTAAQQQGRDVETPPQLPEVPECESICKEQFAAAQKIALLQVCERCCELTLWIVNNCSVYKQCPAEEFNQLSHDANRCDVGRKFRDIEVDAVANGKVAAARKALLDQKTLSSRRGYDGLKQKWLLSLNPQREVTLEEQQQNSLQLEKPFQQQRASYRMALASAQPSKPSGAAWPAPDGIVACRVQLFQFGNCSTGSSGAVQDFGIGDHHLKAQASGPASLTVEGPNCMVHVLDGSQVHFERNSSTNSTVCHQLVNATSGKFEMLRVFETSPNEMTGWVDAFPTRELQAQPPADWRARRHLHYNATQILGSGAFHPRFPNGTKPTQTPEPVEVLNVTKQAGLTEMEKRLKEWTTAGTFYPDPAQAFPPALSDPSVAEVAWPVHAK